MFAFEYENHFFLYKVYKELALTFLRIRDVTDTENLHVFRPKNTHHIWIDFNWEPFLISLNNLQHNITDNGGKKNVK